MLGGNPKDDGVRTFGPEGRTTYANINDLGQANANLMTQKGHENKTYLLNANETVTFRDMAKMWGGLYQKDVPFIHGTRQEFIDALVAKGLPLERAEYGTQFINAVAEGFFEATSDSLTSILGRKPTSLYETFKNDL